MLQHKIGDFVWASGSRGGEACGGREKFIRGEGGAETGKRLLRARCSAELGPVAFGFATQDLWLGNRKVGS